MLNEFERRTLDDIETRLSDEDPTWVEGFGSARLRPVSTAQRPWMRAMLVAGASLTATLALIVIFVGIPALTAFFILCTAGFIWVLDRPLSPPD